jgi:putative oxidoreductase
MKRLLTQLAATTPKTTDVGLLVLRVWFGTLLALAHGAGKMADLGKFTANVAKHGFPIPELFAVLAALSEFAGGLLLAVGLLARPAAGFVLITMLVAAVVVHWDDPFSKKEFALAYGMAALTVLVAGPGKLSLDHRLFGAKS